MVEHLKLSPCRLFGLSSLLYGQNTENNRIHSSSSADQRALGLPINYPIKNYYEEGVVGGGSTLKVPLWMVGARVSITTVG